MLWENFVFERSPLIGLLCLLKYNQDLSSMITKKDKIKYKLNNHIVKDQVNKVKTIEHLAVSLTR